VLDDILVTRATDAEHLNNLERLQDHGNKLFLEDVRIPLPSMVFPKYATDFERKTHLLF